MSCSQDNASLPTPARMEGKRFPVSQTVRFEKRIMSAKGPETALSSVKNDFQMPPALGIL